MVKLASTYGYKSIRPLLKRVGLDDKETEIYLSLLSLKTAGASDVAKLAQQSRSHTYLILRALEEKGLVSEIEEGGVLKFIAESPERLVSYLKGRELEYKELQSLVQGALPALASLTADSVTPPRVTVLKGLDGMKQVYSDLLTQEFMGIYNAQASLDTFGENLVTMLFGEDAKLKGRDLVVQNEAGKQYLQEVRPDEDYRVRLLPIGVTFHTDTVIYKDTVTLFSFDDERTIVRIENRKIADAFRAWFEMLWSLSQVV